MGNRMKGCNLHHPETQGGARCCSVALHHCTTTTPLKGGVEWCSGRGAFAGWCKSSRADREGKRFL